MNAFWAQADERLPVLESIRLLDTHVKSLGLPAAVQVLTPTQQSDYDAASAELARKSAVYCNDLLADAAAVLGEELQVDLTPGAGFPETCGDISQGILSQVVELVDCDTTRKQVDKRLTSHPTWWKRYIEVALNGYAPLWSWWGYPIYDEGMWLSLLLAWDLTLIGGVCLTFSRKLGVFTLIAALIALCAACSLYHWVDVPQRATDISNLRDAQAKVAVLQQSAAYTTLPGFKHLVDIVSARLAHTLDQATRAELRIKQQLSSGFLLMGAKT